MIRKRNEDEEEKDDNLTLDWEEILEDVKPMGRYQTYIVLTMTLVMITSGMATTSYGFTGYQPFHRYVLQDVLI